MGPTIGSIGDNVGGNVGDKVGDRQAQHRDHALDHFVLAPLGFGPADLRELMQMSATTSPLCCSGCGMRMKRLPIKGISVDLCDACGSGWLDAGERGRLVERR